MRRKWIIGAVVAVAAIILIVGAVFVLTQEERTQKAMLRYLEGKYGERFEIEFFDKGDMLFPDMYGDDKMMVHPEGKADIPFYVFKDDTEPSGFYDLYVPSYFSYKYTEKYKQDIVVMDSRELAVKFVLSSGYKPVEAEVMQRSVDEVVGDSRYGYSIHLYVAVPMSGDINIQDESVFLYQLYNYMLNKKNEWGDVHFAIGYIHSNKLQHAEEALRLSHAINFDWNILKEEHVTYQMYFGSRNDIQSPSFFEELFKR